MNYVTLKKSDKNFNSYLMGDFSENLRAIPIENLNINSSTEIVTFKLVKVNDLNLPSFFTRILELLRFVNLSFVLVPYIIVISILQIRIPIFHIAEAIFKIIWVGASLCFLMLAYNLRNDLQDHNIGLDRVNPRSGSRALQNGWFTGKQIKIFSWIFIVTAGLIGVPYILDSVIGLNSALILLLLVLSIITCFLSSTKSNMHSRFSLRLSVFSFLLSGPLLTVTAEWVLVNTIHPETLLIGLAWGLWVVLLTQVKNFQSLIAQVQAGVSSWMTRKSFDQIASTLISAYIILLISFNFLLFYLGGKFIVAIFSILSCVLIYLIIKKTKKLRSPVGTELTEFGGLFQFSHLIISILFILNFLVTIN